MSLVRNATLDITVVLQLPIAKILYQSICAVSLLALCIVALAAGPSAAQPQSDVTVMSYGPSHGTQVEYLGSNGMSYLWYPGNRVVLPAPWNYQNGQICHLYRQRTYNPVTKKRGGNWKCQPYAFSKRSMAEITEGDVFGLSKRRTVPFILPKARTTFSKLAGRPIRSTFFNKPGKADRAALQDIERLKASCLSPSKI